MTLLKDSGWIFGKDPAGTPPGSRNAGFAWFCPAGAAGHPVLAWHEQPEDGVADTGSPIVAFAKITWLYTLAFIPSILGLWLYLPKPTGMGTHEHVGGDPLDIVSALPMKSRLRPDEENVAKQFAIFGDKHTWSLTAPYIVTFRIVHRLLDGAAAVDESDLRRQPRARRRRRDAAHREQPECADRAGLCLDRPFVGAPVPIGGWISDRVGGSIVTQIIS